MRRKMVRAKIFQSTDFLNFYGRQITSYLRRNTKKLGVRLTDFASEINECKTYLKNLANLILYNLQAFAV